MARSLNKVILIGNLTRDPELKYTPTGTAVCTVGLATNRSWVTETGEKKDEVEFHKLVAWRKLAEICGQYLKKGSKIYVEGRLSTRKWTGQDGQEKYTTEVVIDDMIMLDSKRGDDFTSSNVSESSRSASKLSPKKSENKEQTSKKAEKESSDGEAEDKDIVSPDDIPF